MRKSTLLFLLAIVVLLPSCSLFKKKCDCPDHRRQKRIAQQSVPAHNPWA